MPSIYQKIESLVTNIRDSIQELIEVDSNHILLNEYDKSSFDDLYHSINYQWSTLNYGMFCQGMNGLNCDSIQELLTFLNTCNNQLIEIVEA